MELLQSAMDRSQVARARMVTSLMRSTPRSTPEHDAETASQASTATSTASSSYQHRQLMRSFLAAEGMGSEELDRARQTGLHLRMIRLRKDLRRPANGVGARAALSGPSPQPASARAYRARGTYVRRRPAPGFSVSGFFC